MKHSDFLFALIVTFLLISPALTFALDPIGDPNEVWVTSSTGDTIYMGEVVEFQVYLANDMEPNVITLSYEIYAEGGATWDWIYQPGSEYELVYVIPGSSMDDAGWFFSGHLGSPPPHGISCDSIVTGGRNYSTFEELPAGPLEHMYSFQIRPTSTGTICIDSGYVPPSVPQWVFMNYIDEVMPAWGGPYCFTVLPSRVIGDINCDGEANVGDVVYMINWIFRDGPEPCK